MINEWVVYLVIVPICAIVGSLLGTMLVIAFTKLCRLFR